MEVASNTTGLYGKYEEWRQFYHWALSVSDPRVKDWFLMDSPWPSVCLTLAYLIFICRLGPKIMETRKPFDLKLFMVMHYGREWEKTQTK